MIYKVWDIREKSEKDFVNAYNNLPSKRQLKVDKYRFEADRHRCVFSYDLLLSVLCEYLERDRESLEIIEDKKGKLRLKNSDVGFNISHSGNFVACALYEGEVGIDIEEKKEIGKRLFVSALTEKEQQEILKSGNLQLTDPLNTNLSTDFLRLWTAKEAYLKYTGQGLSGGYMTVPLKVTENKLSIDGVSLISKIEDEYVLSVVY